MKILFTADPYANIPAIHPKTEVFPFDVFQETVDQEKPDYVVVRITEDIYRSGGMNGLFWNDFRYIPNCGSRIQEEALEQATISIRNGSLVETFNSIYQVMPI